VRLLPAEKRAIEAEPTSSVEAYNYYLQGRHLYHLHSTQHALMAQRLFRKAIELDPGYARAYSGLADCGWLLITNHYDGASVEDVMEASARALALDPTLPEAHASHGIALYLSGRKAEAFAKFEEAIALDPNLYEAHYLYAYASRDSYDRARSALHYRRAAELAPDDYRTMMLYSVMLRDLGDEEFRAAGHAGIERAERALKLHPEIPLPAALGSAILAALGERTRALEWAERAMTIAPDDSHTQLNVACTFALLGEKERALDLLEKWIVSANKATLGWLQRHRLRQSARTSPVQGTGGRKPGRQNSRLRLGCTRGRRCDGSFFAEDVGAEHQTGRGGAVDRRPRSARSLVCEAGGRRGRSLCAQSHRPHTGFHPDPWISGRCRHRAAGNSAGGETHSSTADARVQARGDSPRGETEKPCRAGGDRRDLAGARRLADLADLANPNRLNVRWPGATFCAITRGSRHSSQHVSEHGRGAH
jgi:tetratricopeptide (TPR) repeat protein